MFQSVNPYNSKTISTYSAHSKAESVFILKELHEGAENWRKQSVSDRISLFKLVLNAFIDQKEELAKSITLEMGKPIRESKNEVLKSIDMLQYNLKHAAEILKDQKRITRKGEEFIIKHEGLGVILGIMPWNFPVWQTVRACLPAILAGNAFLLKPAPNVVATSFILKNIFQQVNFQYKLFDVILADNHLVEEIISGNYVQGVTFTGSTETGGIIASIAGRAIVPSVLELGGSNAFIVFNDANLEKAVSDALASRFNNCGQSCIASKRFIIQDDIFAEFTEKLTIETNKLKPQNPLDEDAFLGPVARADLAEKLMKQYEKLISSGAEIIKPLLRTDNLITPGIIKVSNELMGRFKEEIFGPLVLLTSFDNTDEAVQLSNDSAYGLGVSLYTSNIKSIDVSLFNEGNVFINDYVKSYAEIPFGGINKSGFGKELGSEGLLSFINKKVVRYF